MVHPAGRVLHAGLALEPRGLSGRSSSFVSISRRSSAPAAPAKPASAHMTVAAGGGGGGVSGPLADSQSQTSVAIFQQVSHQAFLIAARHPWFLWSCRACGCNALPPGCSARCSEAVPSWSLVFPRSQSWTTYQKLLEVDFLEHRVLYSALQEMLLRERGPAASSPPLAWLDLGCGDAEQAAALLRACGAPAGALALASYTGVDVSAPALSGAARKLAFLQPTCELRLVEVSHLLLQPPRLQPCPGCPGCLAQCSLPPTPPPACSKT